MNAYLSASRWSRVLLVAAVVSRHPSLARRRPRWREDRSRRHRPALRQSVTVKQSENAVASSSTTVESKQGAFLPSLHSTVRPAASAGSTTRERIDRAVAQHRDLGQLVVFDGPSQRQQYAPAKLDVTNSNDLTRAADGGVHGVQLPDARDGGGPAAVQKQTCRAGSAGAAAARRSRRGAPSPTAISSRRRRRVRAPVSSRPSRRWSWRASLIERCSSTRAAATTSSRGPSRTCRAFRTRAGQPLDRAFASRRGLAADRRASRARRWAPRPRRPDCRPCRSARATTRRTTPRWRTRWQPVDQTVAGRWHRCVVPLFDRGAASTAVQQAKIRRTTRLVSPTSGSPCARRPPCVPRPRDTRGSNCRRPRTAESRRPRRVDDGARYHRTSSLLELTQAREPTPGEHRRRDRAQHARLQNALMPYYTGELDPRRRAWRMRRGMRGQGRGMRKRPRGGGPTGNIPNRAHRASRSGSAKRSRRIAVVNVTSIDLGADGWVATNGRRFFLMIFGRSGRRPARHRVAHRRHHRPRAGRAGRAEVRQKTPAKKTAPGRASPLRHRRAGNEARARVREAVDGEGSPQ